jgi:hypothetical protein
MPSVLSKDLKVLAETQQAVTYPMWLCELFREKLIV